jgi:hypothetical protein
MYWHKRNDRKTGGLWRCAVRKREVQRASKSKKVSDARYYRAPDGGYVRKRTRHLRAQRTRILTQLDQLAKEAASA